MRRAIVSVLLAALLLSGCSMASVLKEPVNFYYIYSAYPENMNCIIAREQWEAAGHRKDLSYLLAMYLMGPSEDHLSQPFPKGCKMISLTRDNGILYLELSDTGNSLSDSDYSLACACLSATLFELTEVDQITIASGLRSITLERYSVIWTDVLTNAPEETT